MVGEFHFDQDHRHLEQPFCWDATGLFCKLSQLISNYVFSSAEDMKSEISAILLLNVSEEGYSYLEGFTSLIT